MASREILCPTCGGRLVRVHSNYQDGFLEEFRRYRVVRECDQCKRRDVFLTIHEDDFDEIRREANRRISGISEELMELRGKVKLYENKLWLRMRMTSIDSVVDDLTRLKKDILKMV